jgi:hypothetical protein
LQLWPAGFGHTACGSSVRKIFKDLLLHLVSEESMTSLVPNFRWNGRAMSTLPYQPFLLARRSPRR